MMRFNLKCAPSPLSQPNRTQPSMDSAMFTGALPLAEDGSVDVRSPLEARKGEPSRPESRRSGR